MSTNRKEQRVIKIGTRGSELALIQTNMVIAGLKEAYPDTLFEIVKITTKGDQNQKSPIYEFGGKAVFVEDIEQAILSGTIDMAVHSAKDMPNPCKEGVVIAGVLERANPCDVLIYKKDRLIDKKNPFVIGTSSLRRQCQIKEIYPNAICKDLRGNVGTRMEKLKNGEYDAIILAKAGITRQGLSMDETLSYLPFEPEQMLPAAGQGIIAIEAKKDSPAHKMAATISHRKTQDVLEVERAVLSELSAGCHEPVGVYAVKTEDKIQIHLMKQEKDCVIRNCVEGAFEDRISLIKKLCNG